MKNTIKKNFGIYMIFMLCFNLFAPVALAADNSSRKIREAFNLPSYNNIMDTITLSSAYVYNYLQGLINYNNWNYKDIIFSIENYAHKNPNIIMGIIAVVLIFFILVLLYVLNLKRMKLEREKKATLEELISYLCMTYDQVEKINLDNNIVTSYNLVGGDLIVKNCALENIEILKNKFHPDDTNRLGEMTIKSIMDRVMKTCGQEELIVREKNDEGNYQWMAYLFQGVRSDKQYHRNCLLLKRNINALKSKELEQREQLQNALAVAQHSAEAKGDFMSRMSHEIRTPLNAIIGYLTLAKEEESKEILHNFLSKSDVAAKHLLGIINDVLDMSAIESGKMKINNALFDFKQTIAVIGNIFYEQAKAKNITFEIILNDVEEEFVLGDKLRLNQILVNLLANAIKFTPADGKVTCIVRQMAIQNKKVFMHFEVIDTGKGMSKDFMKKIFTPFEQESSEIASVYGGSGLGLSITNNLVRMLNGAITVESEEGKGTVFKVDLPFEFDTEHHKNFGQNRDFSFVKALIVDDQENSAKYIEKLLNKFGVATTIALSGAKALEYIEESNAEGHPFHLCLMDWQMPDMDGLETAKRIAELDVPAIKIVVVTGYDYSEIIDKAREFNVASFINKPVFNSNILDLLVSNFGDMAEESETEEFSCDFKGRNVLLAEDNNINADIVTRLLQKANLKVDRAINGHEVCEMFGKADAGYYGVILMDIQMPEIDGYEAAKLIRMSDHIEAKTIPIIAMTANVFSEDVAKALSCGMNGHVGKPIDKKNLYSILEKVIKE